MTAARGLVVAAYGRRGILETGEDRLPFLVKGRKLRVVCGDKVEFEQRAGSEAALVTRIRPRTNALRRPGSLPGRVDVIAANLTQLIAVCAPVPAPDPWLIDRYLCAAELMGCRGLLVWNKSDTAAPDPAALGGYQELDYCQVATSARTGAGIDQLAERLAGQVSVLLGSSGVGKSSLINALFPGAGADVGALSAASGTGTHTTTAVVMYDRAGAGRLIDTPGARDFVPLIGADQRPDQGFVEIRREAAGCRFADCTHTHEPGCAVKEAVSAGRVSQRRYDSYVRLLAEAAPAPRC